MNATIEPRLKAHGEKLLRIFPTATEQDPVKLCRKLRRFERLGAELALQLCNGPEFEGGEDQVVRIAAGLLGSVNTLLGNYKHNDRLKVRTQAVPVFLNRDPRGYALKIQSEWMAEHNADLHRDWGGYGIIAPDLSEGE